MYVGSAQISLVLGESHSLKEKRMVLRRIRDRVRERLGVNLNEVGAHDAWQRAELGCAVVSGERAKVLAVLDAVIRVAGAASDGDGSIVAVARDVTTFAGESVPYVDVDDRTGAGDKAQGDDGWIPDAWRDEAAK